MSAKAQSADAPTPEVGDEPAIVREFRERLLARYPECDTVDAALRRAEQEPSSTDATEFGLCEACGSQKIHQKNGPDMPQKRSEYEYVCEKCRSHFNTPITQTTWEAWE